MESWQQHSNITLLRPCSRISANVPAKNSIFKIVWNQLYTVFKSWTKGCICDIENKIKQKNDFWHLYSNMVTIFFWLAWKLIKLLCSRTLFCFVHILAPFNRTKIVLYSKCTYGSQFPGEKSGLQIWYLITEILSKNQDGTPCMHFLSLFGPKNVLKE